MNAQLLLQNEDAIKTLDRATQEALANAIAKHGDPIGRIIDAIGAQYGILTSEGVADLLGVKPRTVTEVYVKEKGLPHHRTGRTSPPWFILDEVIEWVRTFGPDGERVPVDDRDVVPVSDWEDGCEEGAPGSGSSSTGGPGRQGQGDRGRKSVRESVA